MEDDLQDFVDGERIDKITSSLVPAPPHSKYPGEHLLVNCLYTATVATSEPSELICNARSDLLQIVRQLVEKNLLAESRSLSVSFFGYRTEGRYERLYRYSVLNESYPTDSHLLTIDSLIASSDAIESSEINVVADLLKSTLE